MATTEDAVRAATKAYGETVTEIRPLDLARPAPRTRPRHPRRFPAWVAPVTAAAAVIALAISLVLVRGIPNGPVVPAKRPATAGGAVPRYYADPVAAGKNAWLDLAIGDLFTGARLATIAPPAGSTFANVTGAADDRTFVADTMPIRRNSKPSATAVTWYLVRISPGAAPGYQMSRLSLPDMRSWTIQGVALSASGDELAMALTPAQSGLPARVLQIYSVATGTLLRTWSTTDTAAFAGSFATVPGMAATTPLYWVDGDRALAFPAQQVPPAGTQGKAGPQTERLLDVTASGGDLIADSRVIWTESPATQATGAGCSLDTSLLVTPDAKTVVCGAVSFVTLSGSGNNTHERITLRWLAYSVPATTARTLYQATVETKVASGASIAVLWASPSGDTVIVDWGVARNTEPPGNLGLVSHGTFTPLPSVPSFLHIPGPAW
jgi:hypothetical protein